MMPHDINHFAILDIHGVDYCCINFGISKSKAINLLRNADFSQNSGSI